MKAASIFIGRELRAEAPRRTSLFFCLKRSPSRARAGLSLTMTKTRARVQSASASRTGIVRLQIPDGRASPCPAQAPSTEKFLPTLLCQELDSRIILVGRAAKVQCNSGMQEGKEDMNKACSESLEDFFFFFDLLGFSPERVLAFKLQV